MDNKERTYINEGIERVLDTYKVPTNTEGGTIIGTLGPWKISNNDRMGYWTAEVTRFSSEGLPVEVATELHERKCGGTHLGTVIRADGYSGGTHPNEVAMPDLSGVTSEKSLADLRVEAITTGAPRFVSKYHIDFDYALAPFIEVVKSTL
jgi:hypothetical protein